MQTERETYIQTGMHTCMHAVRSIHAETDIDTYISVMHLQSDRQAHSQPDSYMHSDTLRYRQIHAESAYTGSYTQKSTSTDMHRQRYRDRQRQTYTDRDRQIQTETKHRQTDTFRSIQRQTYTYSDTPAER